MEEFTNKTVLVTGGSRGIGRAVAEQFAAAGAIVYFTYNKNAADADAVAAGCGAIALPCNQRDGATTAAVIERILADTGTIDVLINNAGATADQFLMLMPDEEWEKIIDTNAGGTFRWTKAVSRPMINNRSGVIVNVASVSGLVGIAGQTNYAASKGALLAFSRACAAELGPKGIRVNAVVPGFIETDMTARMSRSIKQANLERILLHRFGTAAEVAQVIVFLASSKASYIIGQTIVVDGGLTGTVAT